MGVDTMNEFCLYGNFDSLVSKLKSLDPTIRWKVVVSEWKSKRSLDQNSRYWKLMTELGKFLGYMPDEMHDICRFKFLRKAVEIEGERLPLLKSTTKLSTAEMAEYQNMIEMWANDFGFYFEG